MPVDPRELEVLREAEGLKNFSPEELKADELAKMIAVRRFAGPEAYVGKMDRIRVAHLTDLHVGRVTPMRVQRDAIELAKRAEPDIVVITGDFVCHSQAFLAELEELTKSYGLPVFAVLGNHDHWSGGPEVARALVRGGAEVLSNANTTIEIRGTKLQIVGLDDAYTSHADRDRALKGLKPGVPVLGLSHIAEEADALWAHGVSLVLSGHTHAGQVTLAGLHELALGKVAGHKYVHGLYGTRRPLGPSAAGEDSSSRDRSSSGAVYVGAGIGAAVMPLRLGSRGKREVTIFELGVGPGAFDEHHQEQIALPGRKPSAAQIAKRAAAVIKKRQRRER